MKHSTIKIPSELDQGVSEKGKTRTSLSKRFSFVLNNYSEDEISQLLEKLEYHMDTVYIFQEEIGGKENTPHLQGYVKFKTRKRAIEYFGNKRIHFELCKGSHLANIEYCSKTDTRKPDGRIWMRGIKIDAPLKLITELYPWQQNVVDIISSEPDDRTIHWFWEGTGNRGKSALKKYLCANFGALCCSGKAADMKYMIAMHKEETGAFPTIVIFDVPRVSVDYMSWAGLEEIKDGCFASTKYESSMVVMNSPHVICFANCEPPRFKMSLDRWSIVNLDELGKVE